MKIRGTTLTTPIARHAVPDDTTVSKKPWSSKNTVDMLCPSIDESGSVVTCEPLEGYPLEVVASAEATQIVRCGKNLFDFKKGVEEIHFTAPAGTDVLKYGYAIPLPAGTYTIHATPVSADNKDRYIFLYLNDANGEYLDLLDYQIDGSTKTYLRQGKETSCTTRKYTFDREVILFVYQGGTVDSNIAQELLVDEHNIQIEAGSVKTDYEPYCGDTFAVGVDIPAQKGINCLYADKGEITVTGKADTVAIINKLTNAIIALGGNV